MQWAHIRQGVTAASGSLAQHLEGFTRWWAGELLGLLPQRLREMMQRRAGRLIVHFDGETAVFMLRELRGIRKIADLEFSPDVVQPPGAGDLIKRACGRHVNDVAVRISETQALRRTLTMPLAAEKNLGEVLAFEMDRHTPFKAEQVYYDFVAVARDPSKRELRVALTLVLRKRVDPLVETLLAWGLEPTSLDVDNGDAPNPDAAQATELNLFPASRRKGKLPGWSWQKPLLSTIAAVLLVTAVALPFVQKMDAVRQLERAVEEARKEALIAEQVRKDLEQLVAEETALVNKKKERTTVIQVLGELTHLLPDSTWLNRFEVSGTRVRLRGESSSASELATLLENSALFQDASFDATVTRDAKTGQERFVISATAVPMSER